MERSGRRSITVTYVFTQFMRRENFDLFIILFHLSTYLEGWSGKVRPLYPPLPVTWKSFRLSIKCLIIEGINFYPFGQPDLCKVYRSLNAPIIQRSHLEESKKEQLTTQKRRNPSLSLTPSSEQLSVNPQRLTVLTNHAALRTCL